MKYVVEESLTNFNFWSGAADTVADLTTEQIETLESMLEEMWSTELPSDTEINDFFWFERDTIAEWLDLRVSEDGDWISDDKAEEWAKDIVTKLYEESLPAFWKGFLGENDILKFKHDSEVADAYEEYVEDHYRDHAKAAILVEFPDDNLAEDGVEEFIEDEWDPLSMTDEENLEAFADWYKDYRLANEPEDE